MGPAAKLYLQKQARGQTWWLPDRTGRNDNRSEVQVASSRKREQQGASSKPGGPLVLKHWAEVPRKMGEKVGKNHDASGARERLWEKKGEMIEPRMLQEVKPKGDHAFAFDWMAGRVWVI